VRDVSSWTDAGEALRFTIGTPRENDRFLDALRVAVGAR
jgi:histidinol-phosphate/aromatic aminotransferase/cobyric acid decarboxylase-like protein